MEKVLQTPTSSELVAANRILAGLGIVDGFGHVSTRVPGQSDHFLIACSKAPALVEIGDIVTLDLNSDPVGGEAVTLYLERFIHSEIYRARSDVLAIVHSHAQSVLPFSIVPSVKLRPVFHMCGFLPTAAPCFEIRECVGDDSDLLIRTPLLGRALAAALADAPIVLMRGHGMTVVGASLRQAVFNAVYAESNARIQAAALGLGEVRYLTVEEARAAERTSSGTIDRAWNLWASRYAGTPQIVEPPTA